MVFEALKGMMNIAEILITKAKEAPDKPAIIFREEAVTFAQLRDFTLKLADSLKNLGIRKQDKIAVYLPNCPEYIYSYLASWVLGATCVPLDIMLTEEELVSCIEHSEAKLLIAKEKPGVLFSAIKEKCRLLQKITLIGQEKTQECLSFQDLIHQGQAQLPRIEIQDKDYAIIFYTSGTTGRPKGVLINYLQLSAPPKSMDFFVDLNAKDITLCALPFSHIGGLIYIQNCVVFTTTIILMERFTPIEFLKNIPKHKVTCFWIVPSMYYTLIQLKEFESFDLSSLRWIVTFGASNSPQALRRFHQYCPKAHLVNGWGLTETNAPTSVLPMGSEKIESVGRPAPWIEVKIFDEQEQELPKGKVGEVVVHSWVVTDGYYKDPELTAQALRGGWFHTGDLGRFDEDGYLYIVGRKKEMLKVAGEIVFEPEVEAVIYRHPAVAEAAVVGVADKLRGEVPKAFIVLKDGADVSSEELRYFLRQHLAHFKIPHYFEFKKELPKNRTGKINKELLRTP